MPRFCRGLYGGLAVRCQFRFGDRNGFHVRPRQILDLVHFGGASRRHPEGKNTGRVNCLRARGEKTFLLQLIGMLSVRPGKHIERRAVFHLLRERRGGTETEHGMHSGCAFKLRADTLEYAGKV